MSNFFFPLLSFLKNPQNFGAIDGYQHQEREFMPSSSQILADSRLAESKVSHKTGPTEAVSFKDSVSSPSTSRTASIQGSTTVNNGHQQVNNTSVFVKTSFVLISQPEQGSEEAKFSFFSKIKNSFQNIFLSKIYMPRCVQASSALHLVIKITLKNYLK